MAHHGLVDVSWDARDMNGGTIELTVAGITWDGQDYLDSIREPKVWGRVKKTLAGTVGSTTLDVVRQTAPWSRWPWSGKASAYRQTQ